MTMQQTSTPAADAFDPILVNPARLAILTTLAAEGEQTFMRLTTLASMTYGNLSMHTRKLAEAGLVTVTKDASGERPVTRYAISDVGVERLEAHGLAVMAAATAKTAEVPAAAGQPHTCAGCGCTDGHACEGGCFWVTPDTCSACAIKRLRAAGRDGHADLLQACADQMRGSLDPMLDGIDECDPPAHVRAAHDERDAIEFGQPRVWRPGDL